MHENNSDSDNFLSNFFKKVEWFEIQKLSIEHDLTQFNCGNSKEDQELNSFLKEDALQQQNEGDNVTYVAVLKNTKKVIGYVTTLTDRLLVSAKEKKDMKITAEYYNFPAIKIGRLATDKNYTGKGIATTFLEGIKGLALKTAETTGCRFLIVDSYKKSIEIYLKNGFIKNQIQNQKTKTVKKKPNGKIKTDKKHKRETISLRYDLQNPKK